MPALSVDTHSPRLSSRRAAPVLDDPLSRARAGRYAARHVLWDSEESLKRLRSCGRRRQSAECDVTVRVSTDDAGTRSAGWGGVQLCGSVWACPVCSAKIAEGRRQEIARALGAWTARGGRVALATFTMRHRRGQSLRTLWDALAYAWSKTTSGRGWLEDGIAAGELYLADVKVTHRATKKRASWVEYRTETRGRVRWIRVVEVTEGESGWHVHVHALLLLPKEATEATAAYLEESMFGRWSAALERRGLKATRWAYGPDGERKGLGSNVRLLEGDPGEALGEYFSKAVYSASFEVARGDLKDGRFGNRTPFAILAAVVKTGDADDWDAWLEWERASQGRRQMAWSQGLKAELNVAEVEDQEHAESDNKGETVATVDRHVFRAVVEARADYAVLMAFEHSTAAGTGLLASFAGRARELEALERLQPARFRARARPRV